MYNENTLRYVHAKLDKKLQNSFFKQIMKTENVPLFRC